MSIKFSKFKKEKDLEDSLGFGKYFDKSIHWLILNASAYLDWALQNTDLLLTKRAADYLEEQKYLQLQRELAGVMDPDLFEDVPF